MRFVDEWFGICTSGLSGTVCFCLASRTQGQVSNGDHSLMLLILVIFLLRCCIYLIDGKVDTLVRRLDASLDTFTTMMIIGGPP